MADVLITGSPREPSRLRFALWIVGGCLVVAAVVGLAWSNREDGDDAFVLPDRLAGLDAVDSDAALADLPDDRRENRRDEIRRNFTAFGKQLSNQYDGAEAIFRTYGRYPDGGPVEYPIIFAKAVRAEAEPLVAVPNAPGLPAGAPADELVDYGEVTCLIHVGPGAPEPPDGVECQRSDSDLTVLVFTPSSGFDLEDIVNATNDLWEDLS